MALSIHHLLPIQYELFHFTYKLFSIKMQHVKYIIFIIHTLTLQLHLIQPLSFSEFYPSNRVEEFENNVTIQKQIEKLYRLLEIRFFHNLPQTFFRSPNMVEQINK